MHSSAILFVAHLLHPLHDLAVEIFLDRDVSHRRRRRCSMPMLLAWRAHDDVNRTNFLDGSAPALHPAAARGHDQGLPERMRVPRGARTGLERDTRRADTARSG